MFGSISETEWQALDTYLAQIPVANPGLYPMASPAAPPVAWETPSVPAASWEARPASITPWYKTTPAIVGFAVGGAVFVLFLLLALAGPVLRMWVLGQRQPAPANFQVPPAAFPRGFRPAQPNLNSPYPPSTPGPYATGTNVEVLWMGRWTPATVTYVNPGMPIVRVQIQGRFGHQISVPTNQIRFAAP